MISSPAFSIGAVNLFQARMKSENTKRSAPNAYNELLCRRANASMALIISVYTPVPILIIPAGVFLTMAVKASPARTAHEKQMT